MEEQGKKALARAAYKRWWERVKSDPEKYAEYRARRRTYTKMLYRENETYRDNQKAGERRRYWAKKVLIINK